MTPYRPLARSEGVDEDLILALGEFLIQFSSLEQALHDAIWKLVDLPTSDAHLLTDGMSFRVLVDKFALVFKERHSEAPGIDDIPGFCRHLETLNTRRNRLVHGFWYFGDSSGLAKTFRRTARRKTGLRFNPEGVTPDEVREFVQQLVEIEAKLWELVLDAQRGD